MAQKSAELMVYLLLCVENNYFLVLCKILSQFGPFYVELDNFEN